MSQDKIPSPYDTYSLDGDTVVLISRSKRFDSIEDRFNLQSLVNRIDNLEANPGHEGRAHDTSLERQALKDLKQKLGV